MSLSKSYATDKTKVVSGVRIVAGINDVDKSEIAFYLTRMSKQNPKYARELDLVTRPYAAQIRTKSMSEKTAQELSQKVFVKAILRGWENVLLSDVTGDPKDKGFAEYSEENANKLFDRLPELLDHLSEQASDANNFRSEELETDAKN